MTGFFVSLLNLIADLILTLFSLVGDLFVYLVSTLLESVLVIVQAMFGGFDTSVIVNAMNAIPPQVFDLAYRVGLKEVSVIVTGALTIKFTLQLIPFVRIGSK